MTTTEALKNINKELKNTNANYGDNIVSLKKLQSEWRGLRTIAEQNQWIKDNKNEFKELGVAVTDINDAENIFVDSTDAVIEALKQRAKAAAAQKLAAEKYEEAFRKRNEREMVIADPLGNLSWWDVIWGGMGNYSIEGMTEDVNKDINRRIERLGDEADAAEAAGDAYFDLASSYEAIAKAALRAAGISEPHKDDPQPHPLRPRDLTSTINQNEIKIQKQYEESITKLQNDEYAKRRKAAADQVQDANNKLREMYRKNVEYVENVDRKYKELTEDQKQQIEQQQQWITATIENNLQLLAYQLEQIQKEQQINALKIRREAINAISGAQEDLPLATAQISITQNTAEIERSLVQERKLVQENLELEYQLILDTNKRLREAGDNQARSEEEILIELNRKKLEIWAEYDQKILNLRSQNIEDQLSVVKKGSDEELQLLLQQNEIRRQLALAENVAKPVAEQVSTAAIGARFDKSAAQIRGAFQMTSFDEQQALNEAIFNEVKRSETEITRFKLQQEKARWEEQIRLAEAGGLDWSQAQIDAAKSAVRSIDRELSELDDFVKNIGKKGLGSTLLEKLGFDDNQIDALQDAVNIILEQFQDILDAEVELTEKQVELAEKRVEAAQKAYDAEIEARNNGYANNVATTKKELENEKKKQMQKQKLLEAAQKRQESLNTVIQASSLVTASANLWSAFSSIPIIGPALAIAAIATMWTSFAAAKIKAAQVTSQSEEYGEGGLEFLEGGSHASGDDIDLKTKNNRGKNMRAEGGEALAIINKRKTRKYKRLLPDVIDSLNKGTFEDKYLNAFGNSEGLNISFNSNKDIDLSKIESDVQSIRKQNETRYYTLPNGTVVMQHKNVKRIIKN